MTGSPTRSYRVSRWLAVHILAFGRRRGLSDSEALDALRHAYRHRAASVQWRLSILDDADRLNVEKHWRGGPFWRRALGAWRGK